MYIFTFIYIDICYVIWTSITGLLVINIGSLMLLLIFSSHSIFAYYFVFHLSNIYSRASKVTITDLPEFLGLMEKNIMENRDRLGCPVEARELSWGNEQQMRQFPIPEVVLVADCIYYEQVSLPHFLTFFLMSFSVYLCLSLCILSFIIGLS